MKGTEKGYRMSVQKSPELGQAQAPTDRVDDQGSGFDSLVEALNAERAAHAAKHPEALAQRNQHGEQGTPGVVVLEDSCTWVPVARMRHLLYAAAVDREDDFKIGYLLATDLEMVDRVRKARDHGDLMVFEPGGRGKIHGDDVIRGVVSREDFARWLKEEWHLALQQSADEAPKPSTPVPAPMARQRAQEHALLAKLHELGLDPLALPRNQSGKPGAKASVRSALGSAGMWSSNTVFDKAWERLTSSGDIRYASKR